MMLKKWEQLPLEMQTEEVRKYYDILKKKQVSLFFKRAFDIFASAVMLVIFSPIFLILAIAIKIDSPGSVFYRQERVTQYGKRFRIHKFRTMVQNADKGSQVTVNNDSRITKVGKMIRDCRLDEIAQLLDVLSGNMTFCATRAEALKYVEKYTSEMMATLLLPAGVTSLASILYKDEAKLLDGAEDTDKVYIEKILPGKMYYNLKSVENFSFWGDIKTMFMTVFAVMGKEYKCDFIADDAKSLFKEASTESLNKYNKVDMNQNTEVSVIIPVYNEEKYIYRCLESLKRQTYPKENVEWLFVDGNSNDKTVEIIEQSGINCRILENKRRLVTYALNIGVENAIGKYIVRMDAHAEYAEDYIEKCVYYLDNIDADNVGGIAITKGDGFIGGANAEILSSKFGVGNSNFRTEAVSGYVDTVPFGAFKREVFEKVGLFDPELPRSEDNDLNSRIRANGGKVFLSSDITFIYYCRNTVKGLLEQALKNGNALFLTRRKNPKAMSLRHYIPFMFVVSLILMPIFSVYVPLFSWLFAMEGFLYFTLDLYFSLLKGKKKYVLYKFVMYPLFHIAYGIGSVIGLFNVKLY